MAAKQKVKLSQYRCAKCSRKLPVERYVYSRFTGSRYCWPGECKAPKKGDA